MEEPLRDATHYVEALRLIGYGLILHDETGGDAVAALARIAALRLRAVEETWNKILDGVQAEVVARVEPPKKRGSTMKS